MVDAQAGLGRVGQVASVGRQRRADDPLVLFGLQLQQVQRLARQLEQRVGRRRLDVARAPSDASPPRPAATRAASSGGTAAAAASPATLARTEASGRTNKTQQTNESSSRNTTTPINFNPIHRFLPRGTRFRVVLLGLTRFCRVLLSAFIRFE